MTADSLTLLGFETLLQFQTDSSWAFELYRRHSPHSLSLMGWVDIHYPCQGQHEILIRACLDLQLVQFSSVEGYGGDPTQKDSTANATVG
ncbi:MAG: hypothetical protein H8E37_06470 [Planctomycetes bacterium]|nr:hypothetical protein [Planctomycetota bacterium]